MKNEKIRYDFTSVYRTEDGISKTEMYKNFDKVLSEKEEKEELYNFNQMLKDWHKTVTIITSNIKRNGSPSEINEIKKIDLNSLKSYDLNNSSKNENFIFRYVRSCKYS